MLPADIKQQRYITGISDPRDLLVMITDKSGRCMPLQIGRYHSTLKAQGLQRILEMSDQRNTAPGTGE
jgi:hypothetical protein